MHVYRKKDETGSPAGSWRAKFSIEGKRFDFKVEGKSRGQARRSGMLLYERELRRRLGAPLASAGAQTLRSLVAPFVESLGDKGNTEKHCEEVRSALIRVADELGDPKLCDVTTRTLSEALAQPRFRKLSPRRRQYMLWALRSFYRWLIRTQRWGDNPAARVDMPRQRTVRKPRRPLLGDELDLLLAAEPATRVEAWKQRRMVYLFAAYTGLRRSEITRVQTTHVDLRRQLLHLDPSWTKNRKGGVLPLPDRLVQELRGWIADRDDELLFDSVPGTRTLRRDLKRAGVPHETAEGVIDFHSLRVTYGTSLALKGVPLAMAQKLMRHSTVQLTANIYSKPLVSQQLDAVRDL